MRSNPCAVHLTMTHTYVDHIAPLASLLKIPLLISDEKNFELTQRYYPEVMARYVPDFEFCLKEIGEEFDTLFDCDYWDIGQKNVFHFHTNREMKIIFCPHGQSDKGYHSAFLKPYGFQENVLFYGSLMQEMLTELNLWHSIPRKVVVGNFRRLYYETHRKRLQKQAQEELFSHLNPKNRTLLFSPTWNDFERAGTFFDYSKRLFDELPSEWNLVIKVHPDLALHEAALYHQLSLYEEKKPNFLMIEEFPPIYPILEQIDLYLGDYSSVGYDFLSFQRPMFFLQKPHLLGPRLHTCGVLIDPSTNIYQAMEKDLSEHERLKPIQKALYQRAFAPVENFAEAVSSLL